MHVNIVTLFPEFFTGPLSSGLMQKAVESGIISFSFINPRDFTDDKRQTVDDRPYGGGPGMVMLAEPLRRAFASLGFGTDNYGLNAGAWPGRLLAMSPRGPAFGQALAAELAGENSITLLCGRYEGWDARLNEIFPLEEVSVGDFVLNGGETAALAVIEATARLLPGFMGHEESGTEESFSEGLLEYPHYTRPESYEGREVPAVLRSGDHAAVARWRRDESLKATLGSRPDLLYKARLDKSDLEFLRALPRRLLGPKLYVALIHYPVLGKDQKSIAVSLTNLDIHDIARSSCSYGLGGFFAVTPLPDQRLVLEEILEHWVRGPGGQGNPDRKKALEKVIPLDNLEQAIAHVEEAHGTRPLLWASSARPLGKKNLTISFDEARNFLYTRPAVLLLGTSHGLAPEVTELCDHALPPLRALSRFNHFSVRSAAALLMDRILGEWA